MVMGNVMRGVGGGGGNKTLHDTIFLNQKKMDWIELRIARCMFLDAKELTPNLTKCQKCWSTPKQAVW